MPLSKIFVPDALPHHKVRALAEAVQAGLVATCNVPEKDLFQLIMSLPADRMICDPTYGDVQRTAEASIVEILFLAGRTVAQKSALFRHVAAAAIRAGFAGDDIMITLTENAPSDWSLGHGRSFGDGHAPMD